LIHVFKDPEYSDVKNEMKQKLKEIRKKYEDSEELDNYYIRLYEERNKKD
jgi:hypothetical protein